MNVNALIPIGVVILFLFEFTFSKGVNESCITPNDENATCVPLSSCKIFLSAGNTKNATVVEFLKQSQCGYEKQPLVCCGTTAFPTNLPPQSPLLPSRETCGFHASDDRILGGEVTGLAEFPWAALLGYKYKDDGSHAGFKCGGALISDRYVLTAGHCAVLDPHEEIDLDIVRLGEWRISTEEDCEKGSVNKECADPIMDLKIEKRIPHSDYKRGRPKNDVALLRLERNVNYNNYVRPVCLPSPTAILPEIGSIFVAVGWGIVENGSMSDVKMKVQLPLLPSVECRTKVTIRGAITENQICAGGERGRDTCQGDSGGPLLRPRSSSQGTTQWYQEGIVSYGAGCGKRGLPGIYTRVSKYIDWIINNMEE